MSYLRVFVENPTYDSEGFMNYTTNETHLPNCLSTLRKAAVVGIPA
jgi:hypothetical protein